MKNNAIILSAGQGKRMQKATPKQYLSLDGRPILYYSLKAYADVPEISNIVVVACESDHDFIQNDIINKYDVAKVSDIVDGGLERHHSVYQGLLAPGSADSDYIFIHDGSRPLIDVATIRKAAEAVLQHPAIVVGIPVTDTVKLLDDTQMVCETPRRSSVWLAQTPQVFDATLIREAYRQLIENEETLVAEGVTITDDAMAVERYSQTKVLLIPGSARNIKITTPEDMETAQLIVAMQTPLGLSN